MVGEAVRYTSRILQANRWASSKVRSLGNDYFYLNAHQTYSILVATYFLVVGKALSHSDIFYYIDHFKLGAELLPRSDIGA